MSVLASVERSFQLNTGACPGEVVWRCSLFSTQPTCSDWQARELEWGVREHAQALSPPFDYVIASDVVYK